MTKISGFHKYFEKEIALFYYVLSLLGIIGNGIDIITLYIKNPTYELELNIIAIVFLFSSAYLYYKKVISLKTAFIIAIYVIYSNMILSNICLNHGRFFEYFLLREAIFAGFMVTAAFLFTDQKHGFIVGISFMLYYTIAVIDSKNEFLITNLYIIFVVFISYILILNLFNKFIHQSISRIQEDALLIKNQNELLTEKNDELNESQTQINAQHEELLTLSESLYKQNEELEDKNKKLEDAIHQKSKFFSIIAHDLKSPISSITSLTEHILEDYENMAEEKKKNWLNKSLRSTKLLYELLENLLIWSRTQIGMVEIHAEPIDISETVEKIINIYKNYASNKSVNLVKAVKNDLTLCADRMMIETILRNLISNAIKYSYEHGVVIIQAEKVDQQVVITVVDSGVGISSGRQTSLFDLEDALVTLGTSGEKGTGLGLRICKEFIEKHNGSIWVESEANKRTAVNFSIPNVIPYV